MFIHSIESIKMKRKKKKREGGGNKQENNLKKQNKTKEKTKQQLRNILETIETHSFIDLIFINIHKKLF